jgi:tRNA threonylcarbamoyladenosine biosynthesis protein TsaB
MIILAIETSTKCGGVALSIDGRISESMRFSPDIPASMHLIPFIQSLLERTGLNSQNIDRIAAAIGPGAFTGLRIGLATAKTLAYFLKIPLVAIPTLDALVEPFAGSGKKVIALLDARKAEVYGAVYLAEAQIRRLTEHRVAPVEDFLHESGDVLIVGDALKIYASRIEAAGGHSAKLAHQNFWTPDPESLARLAHQNQYPIFSGEALFVLKPLYVRNSEAETQWDNNRGSSGT